jgi:hypothetical protein
MAEACDQPKGDAPQLRRIFFQTVADDLGGFAQR